MTLNNERRHFRCPECASRNVRLFAVAKVLVDMSDQPASPDRFSHHIDPAFTGSVIDAWGFKSSAFVCGECGHESRSWHGNADARKTAVEWSEVSA